MSRVNCTSAPSAHLELEAPDSLRANLRKQQQDIAGRLDSEISQVLLGAAASATTPMASRSGLLFPRIVGCISESM